MMNQYKNVLPIFFLLLSHLGLAQVTVKTSKTFPVYQAGETVTFQITSSNGGSATYQLVYDDYKSIGAEVPITLSAGQTYNVTYTHYTAGAVTCKVKQFGSTFRGLAMFAPDQIAPARAEPADFDAFWNGLKQQLSAVPIDPIVTYANENSTSTTYKMSLGNIDGRRVHGWVSIPKGNGSYPAFVHFPAFGSSTQSSNNYMADQLGVIAVALTIHNAPPDQTDPNAYLPNDPANKNTNYYRYAVLAGIRVIDYLQTRPDFNGTQVAVSGESQGGGLATMVAGLDSRVDLLATGIDALTEHSAWLDGKASGFPYYLQTASYTNNQSHVNATAEAIKYYDALYFQKRFKGSTFATFGYQDEICPPVTMLAKLNLATSSVLKVHCPELGHNTPTFFYKGVPDFVRAHFPSSVTPSNNPWAATTKGYQFSIQNNQTATVGTPANITGSYTIDGAPSSNFTVKWEKVSGAGTVTFSNATVLNPSVSFSSDDNYIVKVTITDMSKYAADKLIMEYVDFIEFVVGAGGTGGGGTGGGGTGVYCSASGTAPWEQWIQKVEIGTVSHISSKEGYQNNANVQIVLPAGSTQALKLTPGYSFLQFSESWRVWADWNQDDDFTDIGETLLETTAAGLVTGNFAIPSTAAGKQIKLRIAMKNGGYASPCETFNLGEVEDYILTITQGATSCEINYVELAKVCQQNGTPASGLDDTWRLDYQITNPNPALNAFEYTISGQTNTGSYGQGLTLFRSMNSTPVTIQITDSTNPSCTKAISVLPPDPCVVVTSCVIDFTELSKVCQQNGTPSVSSDDTWVLGFVVSNTANSQGTFNYVYNNQTAQGIYGNTYTLTVPMNGSALSIVISDSSTPTCTITESVQPPAPCDDASFCDILYTEVSKVCRQNNTPHILSDDTWAITFRATNQNPALNRFFYSAAGQTTQGTYGQDITLVQPMNGSVLTISLADAVTSNCNKNVTVTQPPSCYIQCDITYTLVSKTCKQNNTPTTASDDTWELVFRANNSNTSLGTVRYAINGFSAVASYNQNITVNLPMNGQSQNLVLNDGTNSSTCSRTVSIAPPAPCAVIQCGITFTEVSKVCQQNGTPITASDDTWVLTWKATNSNPALTSFTYAINGTNFQGVYGQNYTRTSPMNSNSLGITVTDNTVNSCLKTSVIVPPAPCFVVCGITYTEVSKVCQQNGTPTISSDDTWLLTLRVTNTNTTLTRFNYTIAGQTLQANYGSNITITRAMNGQNLIVTLADASVSGCTRNITITPPPACFTTATAYCAILAPAPWEEWIGEVRVGNWSNTSEKEGYANFTNLTVPLSSGNTNFRVVNTFSYFATTMYTKIWIDANKNFLFESNEMVLNITTTAPPSGTKVTSIANGNFNIPANWFTGTTRMRVVSSTATISTACSTVNKGEAEDYTVSMGNAPAPLQSSGNQITETPDFSKDENQVVVYPNPAISVVNLYVPQFERQDLQVQLIGSDQRVHLDLHFNDLRSQVITLPVEQLNSGMYYIRLLQQNSRPVVEKLIIQNGQ
jgi:cephalosporin-C deacetylase